MNTRQKEAGRPRANVPPESPDSIKRLNDFLNKRKIKKCSSLAKSIHKLILGLIELYSQEIREQQLLDQTNISNVNDELCSIAMASHDLLKLLSSSSYLTLYFLWNQIDTDFDSPMPIDTVDESIPPLPLPDWRLSRETHYSSWEVELHKLEEVATKAQNSLEAETVKRSRGGRPSLAAAQTGSPELILMMNATAISAALNLDSPVDAGYHLARVAYVQAEKSDPAQWARNDRKLLRRWWQLAEPRLGPIIAQLHAASTAAVEKPEVLKRLQEEISRSIAALMNNPTWQKILEKPHQI